jgi:ankyrin repeat protein
MVMLTRLIECGASAPYHRMVKQAKQNTVNSSDVALLALASREGKRFSHDLVQNADYGCEGVGTDKSIGSVDDNTGGHKSNNEKMNSMNKKEKNEKNEDDNTEFLLETSRDLSLNTPLQWSVVKGHLRAVWLLLLEGYSANDVDHLGNNSVHLAAVNGHLQILKVLLEDGGRTNIVNVYKNLPIDMATGTFRIFRVISFLISSDVFYLALYFNWH